MADTAAEQDPAARFAVVVIKRCITRRSAVSSHPGTGAARSDGCHVTCCGLPGEEFMSTRARRSDEFCWMSHSEKQAGRTPDGANRTSLVADEREATR
jgi:hypothetical protein